MELNKYSAIYHNDKLEFTDTESVIGSVKDIKEYIKYELASQCMGYKTTYEELIYNGRLILDLLDNIEESEIDENEKVELYFNPMGSLEIRKVDENE